MKPYQVSNEMQWCVDPEVEKTRKIPGWAAFHKACGIAGLYFDRIERDGRKASYTAVAYGLRNRAAYHIADGRGPKPLDAVLDAYRKAGNPVADSEVALMTGTADDDDFDSLINDEFEGLLA